MAQLNTAETKCIVLVCLPGLLEDPEATWCRSQIDPAKYKSTSSAFGSTLREHEVMMAPKGVMLSDIAEKDGNLWLGSVKLNYVGLAS